MLGGLCICVIFLCIHLCILAFVFCICVSFGMERYLVGCYRQDSRIL